MRLFTLYGRAVLLAAVFVAAFAGMSAAQVKPKLKHVAVVNTEIDESAAKTVKSAGARQITDMLRREATNILLKKDGYNVMTSETVESQLGGKLEDDCTDENCVITLGSRIGAEYIVRGIISMLDKDLTLTVEIYETADGFLIAANGYLISSPTISGLVKEATNACTQMYKIFAEIVKDSELAPKPEPVAEAPKTEPEPVMQAPKAEPTPVTQAPKSEPAPIAQAPKAEPEVVTQKPKPEPEPKVQPRIKKIYTVGTVAEPAKGGRVTSSSDYSLEGNMVTVTATPNKGYRFAGWSGSATGMTNPLEIIIDGNKTLEANFLPDSYIIVVNTNSAKRGRVALNPSQTQYAPGTVVTATATPNEGYRFAGWSGAANGAANPATITVGGADRYMRLSAYFGTNLSYTVNPNNGGAVVVMIDSNQTDYTRGISVTATAKPNSGYVFRCWSGAAAGTTNPLAFIMDEKKTLTAIFDTINDSAVEKFVKIGEQTWMAENLNHKTLSGSWCYGDKNSNCDKYGRLYDWYTAKTSCPNGWHLPSGQEWSTLVASAAGSSAGRNLKSTALWPLGGKGVDSFGFSALPGGVRYTRGGFDEAGSSGYWWTSTESGVGSAYRRRIDYDNDRVGELAPYSESKEDFGKRFGFSVRCLKDD